MHKIDYSVIGNFPEIDECHEGLQLLIQHYENYDAEIHKLKTYFIDITDEELKQRFGSSLYNAINGYINPDIGFQILLYAQNFYGINDVGSVEEAIDLIHAAYDELKHGK
jgi:hypothetical protein